MPQKRSATAQKSSAKRSRPAPRPKRAKAAGSATRPRRPAERGKARKSPNSGGTTAGAARKRPSAAGKGASTARKRASAAGKGASTARKRASAARTRAAKAAEVARPPRRKLGPRQGPSRVRWDRLGRIVLVFVLLAVCYSYLNPAINLIHSHETAAESRQNLRELVAENTRLQERTESMMDPSVLTREARRQGMVAPGERPYVIRDLGS